MTKHLCVEEKLIVPFFKASPSLFWSFLPEKPHHFAQPLPLPQANHLLDGKPHPITFQIVTTTWEVEPSWGESSYTLKLPLSQQMVLKWIVEPSLKKSHADGGKK